MDARETGAIPYHPLPLALGVARYPPYPLLAGAGAAARLGWLHAGVVDLAAAVPASLGSLVGSVAPTADSKPEAGADWLASMGKRFPRRRRNGLAMSCGQKCTALRAPQAGISPTA